MKTIIKYSTFLFAVIILFSTCKKNDPVFFEDSMYGFVDESVDYLVSVDSDPIEVTVNLIGEPQSSAITIPVTVLGESTAVEGTHFSISDLVIPANETVGTITLTGMFANLEICKEYLLKLAIGDAGSSTAGAEDTLNVYVLGEVPFDVNTFIGTYDVAEVDGNGDAIDPYQVTTTLVDATTITVSGLWEGYANDLTMVFDPLTGEFTIPVVLGYTDGTYGPMNICTPGSALDDQVAAFGTYNLCDGSINVVSGYKMMLTEGAYAGYYWTPLIATSEWTMSVKKSVSERPQKERELKLDR